MRPICSPERRCVRIELDGEARWGARDGGEIVLSDGVRVGEATAVYLAPADPSKIIAVHLTYGSRLDRPWLPNPLVRLVRTAIRSAR